MNFDNINQESLNLLNLKDKSNLKERLESNLRIQKMLFNYEKTKSDNENER